MKIFRNLNWRDNKLPVDASRIVKTKPPRRVPFVDPAFFVQNNPRVKANLAQFDPVQPARVRADLKARLQRSVEEVNRMIANRREYKGISFELDEGSGRPFAVVRDKRTGQVIKQIPSRFMLEMAARLKENSGLLKDITL
jgi:uncharacterized FlaG/YvyC family protein